MDAIDLLIAAAKPAAAFGLVMAVVPYMVWMERRVCAWIQDRVGPNRVGPQGLLQPLADGLKFLFKEDVRPAGASGLLYAIAPALAAVPALTVGSLLPFGGRVRILGRETALAAADVDAGLLCLLAVGSLQVYGIVAGGWASNSKYSLLGGLRAVAQMISYELTLTLSIVGVLMTAGTMSLSRIVEGQMGSPLAWNVFSQPLGFFLFFVAGCAENNRHPFDLAEAEPELVGGYHTEYSGLKFALFFLAEYASLFVLSGLLATLFFGGYAIPWADAPGGVPVPLLRALLQALCLGAKMFAIVFAFMLIRWSLPRFRYDQLMGIGWKVLLPLALANIALTGLLLG